MRINLANNIFAQILLLRELQEQKYSKLEITYGMEHGVTIWKALFYDGTVYAMCLENKFSNAVVELNIIKRMRINSSYMKLSSSH